MCIFAFIMESVQTLILGICLCGAIGLRIFVPFSLISVFTYFSRSDLITANQWMISFPVLVIFSVTAVVEIAAYYNPWIDNMMDLITTPLSLAAGIFLSYLIFSDFSTVNRWILAVFIGGGISLNVHLLTVKARALSYVFSSGRGNLYISTLELISAVIITVLSFYTPLISLIVLIAVILLIYFRIIKRQTSA